MAHVTSARTSKIRKQVRPLLAVLIALVLSSCATTPELRRGTPMLAIMAEIERVVVEDGYTCRPSPSREVLHCSHEKFYDLSFSYLPESNYLHIYSSFDRKTDEGFADLWRGACVDTLPDVNQVNANYISKVTCEDDRIFFVFYTWVPDNGLTDDDLRGMTGVVRAAITDAVHAAKMLKPDDASEPERAPIGVPGVGGTEAPPTDDEKAPELGHVESL
jgi:hypothetical protein